MDPLSTTWAALDEDQRDLAASITKVIFQHRVGLVDSVDLELALMTAEQDYLVQEHIEVIVDRIVG